MPPSGPPWARTRVVTSTGPPPRSTRRGTRARASASSVSRASVTAAAPASASARSVSWIWPITTGAETSAWKPPPARTMRAALDAAATTDGSSIAIGIRTSSPSTVKLTATASGRA